MAKRASQSPPPKEPLRLLISRAEASQKIQAQVNEGEGLLRQAAESRYDVERLQAQKREWTDYTKEVLGRIFSTDELASEFNYSLHTGGVVRIATWGRPSPGFDVHNFQESVREGVNKLRSIQRRLELIPEPATGGRTVAAEARLDARQSNTVFLVHGRDEATKSSVARFLERLELDIIILHEQPDKGRTVIEKFEQHAKAGYAVVLMTADDVGASAATPDKLRPRPRQNVVFELGYFVGTLGRTHVCALVSYGVDMEIFSDYSGVLTLPLDIQGGWKLRLAGEMKAAGLPVDMNRAV